MLDLKNFKEVRWSVDLAAVGYRIGNPEYKVIIDKAWLKEHTVKELKEDYGIELWLYPSTDTLTNVEFAQCIAKAENRARIMRFRSNTYPFIVSENIEYVIKKPHAFRYKIAQWLMRLARRLMDMEIE